MDCYLDFAYIYDDLINNDIDYKRWSEIMMNLCEENHIERNSYLDLACGTGNLTSHIAPNFKNVWALDLSSNMLSIAEDKLREKGIKARYICQDISSFELNKKFDLITCCLDSTNYLLNDNELTDYFKSVHNHLENNGVFIFDVNSYYKLSNVLGNNVFTYNEDDIVYIWENSFEDDIVSMYLTFFVKKNELYERFDEEHEERAYHESQLDNYISLNGFKIVKKMDNYESESLGEMTERIVYVLKKQ